MSIALPLLLAALAALEISLFAKAEWLFYAATVAGGIAVGLIFRGGLTEINRQADPDHRAQAVSTYFAAAYLGLGLPVVLIGLISVAIGPIDASAWVAGLVAAIILTATTVVAHTFGQAPRPAPARAQPSRSEVCPDSWCNPQHATHATASPLAARSHS